MYHFAIEATGFPLMSAMLLAELGLDLSFFRAEFRSITGCKEIGESDRDGTGRAEMKVPQSNISRAVYESLVDS